MVHRNCCQRKARLKQPFSILLTYTCPVPSGWVFCCLLIVHPFMVHPIPLPLFIICYLLFDFINLYSISCHCLLWTFIIIDSQLFSPSFRTYAFIYSRTDCCRSQLFFLKEFSFRQQLPLFCCLLLSSIVFPFLLFLMFLYYSCISLFNIFFDSHFRMFRFDHR